MVHTNIRNLSTIRNLSKLGLCISKDRFAHVSVCMGNAVIEMNEQEEHVLPTNLRKDCFQQLQLTIKILKLNHQQLLLYYIEQLLP